MTDNDNRVKVRRSLSLSKRKAPAQAKLTCANVINEHIDDQCPNYNYHTTTDSGSGRDEDDEDQQSHTGSPKKVKHEHEAVKAEEASTLDPTPPWSCDLPYYLQNFRMVLDAVLQNQDDKALFNQEDLIYVDTFNKLSVCGQMLYVRLFQRKLKWLPLSKVTYDEINNDLVPTAQELIQAGFLHNEEALDDLEEALDLLLVPDLRALTKKFHLGSSSKGVSNKQQMIDGILRLSRQKSMFSHSNMGALILTRVKQMAGSCVRVSAGPRSVFSRLLLLFSLSDTVEDDEEIVGHTQLYTMLLVNSGRVAYPQYAVQRDTKLFEDREDVIRYEGAMRALCEVTLAMQGGQWETALELYSAATDTWKELQKKHQLSYQEELPLFLRRFTTGWVYTRILSRGVEILQRLRNYQEAVVALRRLLLQNVYCGHRRGQWWNRLALNLHQHLKQPQEAISAIRDGLLDPQVPPPHRLSLHLRAIRMKASPAFKKYHRQLEKLPIVQFEDVKHVTIQGQLFPHEGGVGKSRFIFPSIADGEEGVIASVEDLCLSHYTQQGFDQGIHGEGSTFSTLFALLLWDIIFMDGIPDVFRSPYQTCPLDLHTDCFYENRKEAIESRVALLNKSSVETLKAMLEDVWDDNYGTECSLINWQRFSSLHQIQTLVACMGGAFLSAVISRMAKDYIHCRGGLPDLVVWNTLNNSYKLVEVKGPTDRLSQKQQIWLDEFQKLGADVEVCHVEATGAKRSRLE